ncbi:MAG: hypothetical protein J7501_08430 [Bdellovibrio sp.]|nr:hypothetical protein [Bdellovibrio sp.]
MGFVSAGGLSVLSFMAIVIGICLAFVGSVGVVSERLEFSVNKEVLKAGVGILLWLAFVTAVVMSKILLAHPFPLALIYLAFILSVTVGVALSKYGNRFALGLSVTALIAFQGFRFPLELVLHQWATQGTIPETMTWTGKNWDVLTGLLAIFIAPWAGRSKYIAWFFNIFGITMLLHTVYVAIMSSPMPFAWDVHPKLLLVFFVPYFLIVPVCLGAALAGHVILTKALLYGRV